MKTVKEEVPFDLFQNIYNGTNLLGGLMQLKESVIVMTYAG